VAGDRGQLLSAPKFWAARKFSSKNEKMQNSGPKSPILGNLEAKLEF